MQPVIHAEHVTGLDRERLKTQLTQCLAFGVEHTRRLSLYASHWTDDDDKDLVRMEDKVLAETAILALLASRVPDLDADARRLLAELTGALAASARNDRIKSILLRCPHNAAPLGIPQIVLNRLGHGDDETLLIIRGIFSDGLAEALERIPYRAMECSWVRHLLEAGGPIDVRDALPLSAAMRRVHPVTMTRSTAYAVTHALMYATDFGALPAPPPLASDALAALIDACAAWTLVNEDLDLLIEFVIAATLLGRPWSPYISLGWTFCTSVWNELGFLPSPSFEAAAFRSLAGDAASAYAFRHVYHTNYVGGLLCSILLSGDGRPGGEPWTPPRVQAGHLPDACFAAIRRARAFVRGDGEDEDEDDEIPMLPSGDPEAAVAKSMPLLHAMLPNHTRWEPIVMASNLPPLARARVLTDAAITHAARMYDLPKLLTALDLSMGLPAEPSLTAVEGISFLLRQQLPDGCVGLQFLSPDARRLPVAVETTAVVCECLGGYANALERAC